MPAGLEAVEGEGFVSVVLSGELDVSSASSLEEQLLALEQGRPGVHLVIDLRGLRFIDSTGLSLLINADIRARKAGRRVSIVPGDGAPSRLLGTTGLAARLDIVEAP